MSDQGQETAFDASVGDQLRLGREAKGLTLDDVAAQTRIPIRHLRSIEDSRWEDLPAVTYTVGFARNYANAVGLDGAAIGRTLRDQIGGVARPSTVSPEIYAPSDPARAPSRTIVWIAALLLIALVAAYLVWRSQSQDSPAEQKVEQADAAPAPEAAPPAAPQNVTGQQVTLVANADTWMSVTDRGASNRRLFYNTLRQGERFQVPRDAVRPVIFTANPQNLRVMIGEQDRGALAAQGGRVNDQSLKAEDLATLPALSGGATGNPAAPPAP